MKQKPSRVLGLDYGLKRIGVALSDERKVLASPLTTLEAARKVDLTATLLAKAIAGWEAERSCVIDTVVIGLPLHLSGKVGVLADEVKELVEILRGKIAAQVLTWDERLTTVQAERVMREGSFTRKQRSQSIDQATAVIILQSYLDTQGGSYLSHLD